SSSTVTGVHPLGIGAQSGFQLALFTERALIFGIKAEIFLLLRITGPLYQRLAPAFKNGFFNIRIRSLPTNIKAGISGKFVIITVNFVDVIEIKIKVPLPFSLIVIAIDALQYLAGK